MPSDDLNEQRWAQHRREHDTADQVHRREHEVADRAVRIAVETVDRRLDALNELRAEVVTDRGQFTRTETHAADIRALDSRLNAMKDSLESRVNSVEKMLDKAEGALNTWRWIASFLGVGGAAAIVWALISGGNGQ